MSTTGKKRTGIFGGSFNPIHNSHLALCHYAKIVLGLDRIVLIPTGDNPFKDSYQVTREQRYEMTCLAVKGLTGYEVSDIEIKRPGESYTVDTLRELPREENEVFYFISGSDILMQLRSWKKFDELCDLTNFAVVKRKDVNNDRYLVEAEHLHMNYGAGIYLLEDYMPRGYSSTKVREMIKNGEDISVCVPEAVERYIKENGLYL